MLQPVSAEFIAAMLTGQDLAQPVESGITPAALPDDAPGSVDLGAKLREYAGYRALSPKQLQVLELHLAGWQDKEIADTMSISSTTVYEHWRRMAEKACVRYKSGVLGDFYRYLREPQRLGL